MPNAIVNGISIDYSTAGEGKPVLLICGTGQPADLWFAQVADLAAAGHAVITFDNRGCGRSEAPPAPYLVDDMAADTAALIEHLGLGPCDVIGYSLGRLHRPGTRRDPRRPGPPARARGRGRRSAGLRGGTLPGRGRPRPRP